MSEVTVFLVNDEKLDRYVAYRRIAKSGFFGEILEALSGDLFLEQFFSQDWKAVSPERVALIFMDINMPGLNGFETLEELERRLETECGPDRIVAIFLTSSNNPSDRERAKGLKVVKGYFTNPMNDEDVEHIHTLCFPKGD
ncbi:response regulator [Puniceibacterium sediminis]|uniref:Response regulator receiver domain-containing protein n=1 Tax=Puniceibacterium sediminis TaxID=1608407 RepID=A0A238WC62_9RHOB|nr:response regulator [Puniceibacterium sediminis]SNR43289.1 Response regulator receiver domain-containing protein [Puniceibacterium sediminis]